MADFNSGLNEDLTLPKGMSAACDGQDFVLTYSDGAEDNK